MLTALHSIPFHLSLLLFFLSRPTTVADAAAVGRLDLLFRWFLEAAEKIKFLKVNSLSPALGYPADVTKKHLRCQNTPYRRWS